MPSSLKSPRKERLHNRLCLLKGDKTPREREDIGVIVLPCKRGEFGLPAERGAHAVMSIERHGNAVARAADSDA